MPAGAATRGWQVTLRVNRATEPALRRPEAHSDLVRRGTFRHRSPMNSPLKGRWQSAAQPAEPMAEPSADDPDVRWLSYAQIATLRGISRASAERMVRKHRWRRTVNNHGITVAAVPLDYAQPDRAIHPEQSAEPSADHGGATAFDRALAAITAAHSAEWSVLREQAEKAEARATAAETRADRAEQQADEANKRADVAVALADRTLVQLAEAEERADAFKERLEILQAETTEVRQHAREAEDAIETMRRADDARRARGRWARVRAAWRGE